MSLVSRQSVIHCDCDFIFVCCHVNGIADRDPACELHEINDRFDILQQQIVHCVSK